MMDTASQSEVMYLNKDVQLPICPQFCSLMVKSIVVLDLQDSLYFIHSRLLFNKAKRILLTTNAINLLVLLKDKGQINIL